MAPTTCVSSPGKVLLAGGYLVLEPAYSGVVVSTSSRFYSAVQDATSGDAPHTITVRSPQFLDATWTYRTEATGQSVAVSQISDGGKNKFVHIALQRTIALAAEMLGAEKVMTKLQNGLVVTIVGDNDFYSQRTALAARNLPPTIASLSQLPPLNSTNVHIADVHKTGLGSSAALITSLVTSLLIHLNVVSATAFTHSEGGTPLATSEDRRLAHNLAQYVHCFAQGKVGSGFDVAAAVFGSQLYRRFDPAVLKPLMQDDLPPSTRLKPILDPFNQGWNYGVEPFRLPPYTRLMLADVDAGSDTPSLVGKVLKWRQSDNEKALTLWTSLDQSNSLLARYLLKLSSLHDTDPVMYKKVVKYLSTLQPVQWLANPAVPEAQLTLAEAFYNVHSTAEDIRAKMREMGTLSDVPIEPKEQTEILDACVSQAGVIAGGVPGAGGYDALWLLVCDPADCPPEEHPIFRVEGVWGSWKGLSVSPLSATESVAKGCRLEDVAAVPGLRQLLSP